MQNNLLILENVGLISLLVIGLPIIMVLMLFPTKNKLSEKSMIYMYAFSTGLLVILSTLGLIKESFHELEHMALENQNVLPFSNEMINQIIIIGGGITSGLIFAITLKVSIFKYKKYSISKKEFKDKSHSDEKCCVINFEELIKKNGTIASIFIISSHKFIDGISLGIFINSATSLFDFSFIGIILLFILHDLPITAIIFYLQRNSNISKLKSIFYIFILSFITIPFIFIGAFLGNYFETIPQLSWMIPFLEAMAGSMLLFTTIMEFAPEFIHNHHLCSKHWYITVLWLSLGIALSSILTMVHIH